MQRRDEGLRDPWLWGALLLALVLRALPLWIWSDGGCYRDECSYVTLADGVLRGKGVQPIQGWLWAPAYPYFLAASSVLGAPTRPSASRC